MLSAPRRSRSSGVGRAPAIDAVRGAIMVVMALDHVREFVPADAMVFNARWYGRYKAVNQPRWGRWL